MAQRLPTLTITSPLPNAVVGGNPFTVTGIVTSPEKPEPINIQSVSVQIDSQPPIQATLKHLTDKQQSDTTFSATVQITAGPDPHIVTVSVASDAGIPVIGRTTVTVGARFVAPSAWVDIAVPEAVNPTSLSGLLGAIAQGIANLTLVKDILALNSLLVGPNVVAIANPPALRIGFWIVEDNFAPSDLIQPTADFPLPQMTPEAAAGCFDLVSVLPFQGANPTSPATSPFFEFALAVPTATIQRIVDALFPTLNAAAERHGLTLNSITIQQPTTTNSLVAEVSGSYASFSVSGTVTETLGTAERAGTRSKMAAVLNSSISSGLLDALSAIIPILGPVLIGIIVDAFISSGENDLAGKVYSSIGGVLDLLPAWIPFRNSLLGTPPPGPYPHPTGPDRNPNSIQLEFPFPMVVLNFISFGTNGSGIIGIGTGSLANRDQSMVAVNLTGPSSFHNYSSGTEGSYGLALTAFEPNNDQMTWQLSGVASTKTVDIDRFSQEGSFSTAFPISSGSESGSETFTLSVSGTETCAVGPLQDPPLVLTATTSLEVTVQIATGHQPEVKPAASARGN